MPTYARGQIVVEDQVGVYHCIARCVRRAFLCGVDPYTGQDFSHRKEWILDRMRELAGLFAIEVCGYSVMSNHLHLVLRNRRDIAEQWSDDEIAAGSNRGQTRLRVGKNAYSYADLLSESTFRSVRKDYVAKQYVSVVFGFIFCVTTALAIAQLVFGWEIQYKYINILSLLVRVGGLQLAYVSLKRV